MTSLKISLENISETSLGTSQCVPEEIPKGFFFFWHLSRFYVKNSFKNFLEIFPKFLRAFFSGIPPKELPETLVFLQKLSYIFRKKFFQQSLQRLLQGYSFRDFNGKFTTAFFRIFAQDSRIVCFEHCFSGIRLCMQFY